MLDQDLIEQLKGVFEKLEGQIKIVLHPSKHAEQSDLEAMLKGLTQASHNIELVTQNVSPYQDQSPYFEIHNPSGQVIRFAGIPNGHEFSSLVLAILNSDFKGKLPDERIIQRIKSLKGPIHLRTFVSLTCENCPEVVQALNLLSLYHNQITHEMVDGQYFQAEIDELGIMGVPTVVQGNTVVHSGRSNLLQLIEKLETQFGINEDSTSPSQEPQKLGEFDVVVIGGGPAGASSAIYTVRKGLKTAILAEKRGGQVAETRGIENLISVPYTEGPALTEALYKHIEQYPIEVFIQQRVKAIENHSPYKTIQLESGDYINAKSVIIATGAKWRELNVPGEKEFMGRGVAYCPHCDGPFYKGKTVSVVGGGNSGVEAAIDLAGIVGHVYLIEYNDQLKADQILVDKLKSLKNVTILTNQQTVSIQGDDKKVKAMILNDRVQNQEQTLALDGVFIQIGLIPNSQFVKDLVDQNKFGEIIIDHKGRTSVKGIYAAGDVTTVAFKQIIISMGEGAKAGLAAFEDLVLN